MRFGLAAERATPDTRPSRKQKTPLAKVGDGEAARSLQRALTERYAGTALVMS